MTNAENSCFCVYVLRSETSGRRYVGSTKDVNIRLSRHNAGHSKSTRAGRPWRLVYTTEAFPSRSEAVKRELFLKSGKGRECLDNMLS
ncbi:MAG: GIY-YIG nuclease family protein [Planctomycetes bacterium]|nr:GIY-YIG nuclease family protein [Planctomycetota bacterium]